MIHGDPAFFACPSGSTGSWTAECDHGTVSSTGSCYYTPTMVQGDFGDWGELSCPSGMHVIGGGCWADGGARVLQASRPSDEGDRWICGGHGGPKRIWAMCSYMAVQYVKVDGGDWNEASCPSGTRAIGGGCDAHNSPHVMEFHGVKDDDMTTYECGGSGAPKTTWAICAHDDGGYSRWRVDRGDWGSVQCEPGQVQLHGGCQAKGSPH